MSPTHAQNTPLPAPHPTCSHRPFFPLPASLAAAGCCLGPHHLTAASVFIWASHLGTPGTPGLTKPETFRVLQPPGLSGVSKQEQGSTSQSKRVYFPTEPPAPGGNMKREMTGGSDDTVLGSKSVMSLDFAVLGTNKCPPCLRLFLKLVIQVSLIPQPCPYPQRAHRGPASPGLGTGPSSHQGSGKVSAPSSQTLTTWPAEQARVWGHAPDPLWRSRSCANR